MVVRVEAYWGQEVRFDHVPEEIRSISDVFIPFIVVDSSQALLLGYSPVVRL